MAKSDASVVEYEHVKSGLKNFHQNMHMGEGGEREREEVAI